MKSEDQLKQFLLTTKILRFPLIILVIYIHIIHEDITQISISLIPNNVFHILYSLISQNLGRIAVPCFFVFSGFLFFMKIKGNYSLDMYKEQISKRIKTLLIPYFIWNIIFVTTILLKNYLFTKLNLNTDDNYYYLQNNSIYKILWQGPIDYPLWYLRDLIIMCIISPLIYYITKKTRILGIVYLAIFYLSSIEIPFPGLSTTAIFFFGLGVYFTNHITIVINGINKFGRYNLVLSFILLLISTYFNGVPVFYELFIKLFTISGIFSLIYIGNIIQKNNAITSLLVNLSVTVFFIYAIHVIYIINLSKGIFFKISFFNTGYGVIIGYLLSPILVLFICLLLYYSLKKIAPRTLNTLTGSRA